MKIWDDESRSYNFEKASQVDYLANYFHLSQNVGNIKGAKILEVGSGSGQMSAYLASKGAEVHLVDISKKSLEFSRRYFASNNLSVRLYKQNAFGMKFPLQSFDCVWNGGVVEHFNDKEKILMIKKMWELVKPNGKLVIMVPNAHDFPFMLAKKILQLRKKWAFGKEDDLTKGRIENLANQAGIYSSSIYSYNPIVGFWFFPYGREVANLLGLNNLKFHKAISPFGHVIVFSAKKPSK